MAQADRDRGTVVETRELVVPRLPGTAVENDQEDRAFYASQWQLMRRRFFRHKVAVGAMIVLGALYLAALFSPFLSPHDPVLRSLPYKEAPPMVLRFFEEGRLHGPFVYPLDSEPGPGDLRERLPGGSRAALPGEAVRARVHL